MSETSVVLIRARILARVFNLVIIALMNLWVYPLLLVWTLIGSLIALPALLVWHLASGWPTAKITHLFVWIYGRGCILFMRPFIRLECKDLQREYLPCPGILVMNHYSFFDTYMLCMLPVFDAHICLRSWPFRMFWYSIFMRLAEYFDLERFSWEQTLTNATRATQSNRYLVMFPEGHRSRTGKPMRFYSGAFKLAVQLKVPILPLCITGTQTLLPPKRWWLRPARIQLQLLKPAFPDSYQGQVAHIQMRQDVYRQMIDAIQQMQRS